MKPTKKNKSLLLFYLLIGYTVAQISWWIFQIILLSKQLDNSGGVAEAKVRMLAGEFAVFFIILSVGVFYVHKVFKKELNFSQTKKNFSLSITHELKTPITTSKLFIESLQNHRLEEEKKQVIYSKIYAEQERLNQLIEKILLSSRMENAEIKLNKSIVNVREYLNKVLSSIQTPQKVNLIVKGDSLISIDEFYFRSVITNLVENASKYSEDTTEINIEAEKKNGTCQIRIIDQGVGIPEAARDQIFEMYYRLENEEVRNTKGTGLGLFLVKQIVELHKGKIKVKSNDKVPGSTFIIELPIS